MNPFTTLGKLAPPAALLVTALAAGALVAPASAAQHHGYSESFSSAGSGAGQLSLVFPELEEHFEGAEHRPITAGSGIAVNDKTHDVYVADTANHRVAVFDPSRAPGERFVRAFGAGVGGPGVDVCTTSCVAGSPGTEPGEITSPTFIAVDNSAGASHGDVYVADTAGSENRITKFDDEGKLITSWGIGGQLDGSSATTGGPFKAIQGIGVDPAGDLWVGGGGGGGQRIFEFDQSGAVLEEWPAGARHLQPAGVALDGDGRLYGVDGDPWGPIFRFTTAGVEEGAVLGLIGNTFTTDIAADQSTHDLYADREGLSIADISPRCEAVPKEIVGLCTPTDVFGEGNLRKGAGLGVDSSDGTVYAASTETDQIAIFPVTLEANTEAAGAILATSATLHGTVDPKGTPVSHCRFQYGEEESYGQEAPCLDSAGKEVGTSAAPINAPIEVHAEPKDLNGGAGYHFRVRLGNEAKEFLSSEDMTFSTLPIATVTGVKVSELTSNSATLTAEVNPKGVSATTCEVQFAEDSEFKAMKIYGHTMACEPSALGSGSSPIEVRAHLSSLTPNVPYHFNFSIQDANGTTVPLDHTFVFELRGPASACPNESLREANDSMALPDCRAYELVTPIDKNGALIGALLFNNIPPQISDNGTRVIVSSIQCFADSPSCVGTRTAEGEPFQFDRTPDGWAAQSLAIPASVYETSSAWGYNADTGDALFSSPSPPSGQDDWYVRAAGGSVSDLGPVTEHEGTITALQGEPILTTTDFSHVVYETAGAAWKFDQTQENSRSIYQLPGAESNTTPQLVAVSGGPGSNNLIGTCGARVAGAGTFSETYGSLSADGHTSYFQVEPCKAGGSGPNKGHAVVSVELFARIDGEGPEARTVAISQPAGLSPVQSNPACTSPECLSNTNNPSRFRDAEFEGASADDTMAYFTSPQQLTDDASQDHNAADSSNPKTGCSHTQGDGGCNLYLFADPQQKPLSGTHLFDVSAGDTSGLGPEVQGMFALSTDGTHAYFVAKGVLTEAPNPEGERAVEGANNLYLYEHDAEHPQGQTKFIAKLSNTDQHSWSHGISAANTTPDGRYLVFESSSDLTSAVPTEGPKQIYRYDAVNDQLERISFGRQGFNDDGNAGGPGANAELARVTDTTVFRSGPDRSDPTMSDDGSVVFFQSPVALTPGALDEVHVNETAFAQNIYEWESQGTGACSEPGGCISLISDGKDTSEPGKSVNNAVELLGSDRTAQNVFFATASRLTPADTDTQRDYYDARVGGGFPVTPASVPCQDEACHPGTSAPPVFGPLSSYTFSGPGNATFIQPPPTQTHKPETTAQIRARELKNALKSCRRDRSHKKRAACERQARKRYRTANTKVQETKQSSRRPK